MPSLLLVLLAVCLMHTPVMGETDPARGDGKKLQGTWVVIGGEEKGRNVTEEEAKREAMRFLFKGDRVTVVRGEQKGRARFALEPRRAPAWIDLGATAPPLPVISPEFAGFSGFSGAVNPVILGQH